MTATPESNGFPSGYFVIRSVGSNRMADVEDDGGDGAEIILFPEKEKSLVDGFRDPGANNQVFFIDPSGALCSRSSGHAIDVEGDRLIMRHRRPVTYPYPNRFSHPYPKFAYAPETGEITVHFECDPSYYQLSSNSPMGLSDAQWKAKTYVLTSIPMRKPRTVLDDTSEFISANILNPIRGGFGSMFGGQVGGRQHLATADEVVRGNIELGDDEVVEEERREEDEIDDSGDDVRRIKVIGVSRKEEADKALSERARSRRRWVVTPLRRTNAKTGA